MRVLSNSVQYESDDGDIVVAGHLNDLIELLYSHNFLDPSYCDIFILGHQYIIDSDSFFRKLKSVYDANCDSSDSEAKLITMRVVNLFKKWMKIAYLFPDMLPMFFDCANDLGVGSTWGRFLTKSLTSSGLTLERKLQINENGILPSYLKKKELEFLDIEPIDLARQITISDYILYSKINPSDLIEYNSNDSESNIQKLADSVKHLSLWAGTEIVRSKKKVRPAVLSNMICLTHEVLAMQNYHSGLSLFSGLCSTAIQKVPCWKYLNKKTLIKWKRLNELMDVSGNFSALRKELNNAQAPLLIPISILLHDLNLLNEMPYIYEDTDLLNFCKLRTFKGLWDSFEKCSESHYDIDLIPDIQDFLKYVVVFSEEEIDIKVDIMLAERVRKRKKSLFNSSKR
eukprot:TRINITY_DN3771_c0_g1_i2.p1 TRINITY_DN3771_c0_g1~~TRINITY_DN3771_c0_g1_i2.p1  ORF type:complete len:399 (+),score=60.15 TRINITY_DN3771_c0_g1_i2:498-1694(+)